MQRLIVFHLSMFLTRSDKILSANCCLILFLAKVHVILLRDEYAPACFVIIQISYEILPASALDQFFVLNSVDVCPYRVLTRLYIIECMQT